jgi:hypothetical protein
MGRHAERREPLVEKRGEAPRFMLIDENGIGRSTAGTR